MKANSAMLVLAREYRGRTQEELARSIGVGQARIAKWEGGAQPDIPDPLFALLCDSLGFPPAFFEQTEELLGFGSSAYYYRKKADLTAADRRRIHGLVNLLRIHVKRMLASVEIETKHGLPQLDLEDYGGSAARTAQAVRAFWALPEGPVRNVTALIESAGVIVVPCDFPTRSMDATSLRLAEMPPLIFVNASLPADRWRFTLVHELAHLIVHQVPHETMEDEADAFAAEFLLPEIELRAQFARISNIRLQDLANLKPYWKTSIGALLKRAGDLGYLSDNQKRYLWSSMSKNGWRTQEPHPLPKEEPTIHRKLLEVFTGDLGYSAEEMAEFLKVTVPGLRELHGVFVEAPAARRLRVVS